MEKKMETTRMKKMETTITGYIGFGLRCRRSGKENGNYYDGVIGITLRIHSFMSS